LRYLIDGYNLLFQIQEHESSLRTTRTRLIEFLGKLTTLTKLNAVVVFDSRDDIAEDYPSVSTMHGIEIIYAPKGKTADDYLLELLEITNDPHRNTIVTSDRQLTILAKGLGAKSKTIETFLNLLTTKRQKLKIDHSKPDIQEDDLNFNRLLVVFEKKIQDANDESSSSFLS